jgi:RNA polymerase primary sigma factor
MPAGLGFGPLSAGGRVKSKREMSACPHHLNGFFFNDRNFPRAGLSNPRGRNRTEKNAATKGLPMPRPHSPSNCAAQSPLEIYLREINETPLLSAAQEKELAYRVENGDGAARDYLARANLRLVVNIARRYAGKGLGLQDLIAEGNLGLLRAVERFDPSMNTRFSTYASYWIKQSIKRALVNTGHTIRLPAYVVELLTKWRRATAQLNDELGRTPTLEEVAQVLNLPKKKLNIIKKAISIYNASPQGGQAESDLSLDELFADTRETLKEIGERLGLTRERVRQIEVEALGKLREQLEAA